MTRFDDEAAWKDKHRERLARKFADEMVAMTDPWLRALPPEEQERRLAAFEKAATDACARAERRRGGH